MTEPIALWAGLFLVVETWIAIVESRVGPFASHAFRGAALLISLFVPAWCVVRLGRGQRAARLPAIAWALLAVALVGALTLFATIQPFHPDHDDTFRAGFVRAILATGYPAASRWWTAAAPGTVVYYLLVEDLAAQVCALFPSLSTLGFYAYGLKLAYLAATVLLGFALARSLGALDRLVVPGRLGLTVVQLAAALAAFALLLFGATPFDLAFMHLLHVSQSGIGHPVLLVLLALVAVRPATAGLARNAVDLSLYSLPAFMAASKFPFAPALFVAVVLHWLLAGQWREGLRRSAALFAYLVLSTALAMSATRLGGAAEVHPVRLMPLQLFRELAPEWFHFASWPLALRVGAAFGLVVAPLLALMAWLARANRRQALGSPTRRVLALAAAIMVSGYLASATVAFVDRRGDNELYWFVQGWSALAAITFVAIIASPPSWLKLAAVPFALWVAHANLTALRHAAVDVSPAVDPAALEACDVVTAWMRGARDRRASVIAHPFGDWAFAACTPLPTLAPPDDRYDSFARVNPILLPSRRYMQALVSAPTLLPPPPELRATLARFAHVVVIRPRARPLADARARLAAATGTYLVYDWPTR